MKSNIHSLTSALVIALGLSISSCELIERINPPVEEPAEPCVEESINLSTGYNNSSGQIDSVGLPDDDWRLVDVRPGSVHDTLPTPQPAIITATSGSWADPVGEAAWISPGNGNQWEYYAGFFTYERCFTIDDCCQTPLEALLSFRSDNWIEILLNGKLLYSNQAFYLFSPSNPAVEVDILDALRDGENCLRVEVYNAQSSSGNPTPHGLLVEGGITLEDCCEGHEN